MPSSMPIEDAKNIGPASATMLRSIGVRTHAALVKLGWQKTFAKLLEAYPERISLNMAYALLGACQDCSWQALSAQQKAEAKDFVARLRKRKKKAAKPSGPGYDDSDFCAFIVDDQLAGLPVVAKRMFGGHGLYLADRFFGIIHRGRLFFKTNEQTRPAYTALGMSFFKPNAKQSIKAYYEVPADIMESKAALQQWAQEAAQV